MGIAVKCWEFDPSGVLDDPLSAMSDWVMSCTASKDISWSRVYRVRQQRFGATLGVCCETVAPTGGAFYRRWLERSMYRRNALLLVLGAHPLQMLSGYKCSGESSEFVADDLVGGPWQIPPSARCEVYQLAISLGASTLIGHDAQFLMTVGASA